MSSIKKLLDKKHKAQKITMLSCYDYPTAKLAEAAGVDVILVGDSLGPKILGYNSPNDVTMEDMIHHIKAVRRGVCKAYLLADLPSNACLNSKEIVKNAKIMKDLGVSGIKIEIVDEAIVQRLSEAGIEVCVDFIYPAFEGEFSSTRSVLDTFVELENAGACLAVLTMTPEDLASDIAAALKIPVIGVGSGKNVDGQVLIAAEMLGLTEAFGSYNRRYESLDERMHQAFRRYVEDVTALRFPE